MHSYQVSQPDRAQFTVSRRQAAATALAWARATGEEALVWSVHWPHSLRVWPLDRRSTVEGLVIAMDAKHGPSDPGGPSGGGSPVPVPLQRAA